MASKIFRRPRNADEDEVVSARASIRNFCISCMNYQVQEVERCTAVQCWLYPWRMGRTPAQLKSRRRGANLRGNTVPTHVFQPAKPRGEGEPTQTMAFAVGGAKSS